MMKCTNCGSPLEKRVKPTTLDVWLGVWYDHPLVPLGDCSRPTVSVLIPSSELIAQNEELCRLSTALGGGDHAAE